MLLHLELNLAFLCIVLQAVCIHSLITLSQHAAICRFHTIHSMAGFGKSPSTAADKVIGSRADPSAQCPCGSGLLYGDCCKPYHDGSKNIAIPAALVRARFTALSLGNVRFVVETTDPTHKQYVPEEQRSKRVQWERDITKYTQECSFLSLVFDDPSDLAATPFGSEAFVSFVARIQRGTRRPEELVETSKFLRNSAGKWLYAGHITSLHLLLILVMSDHHYQL
jgi:SEC-C motif-containing protein